MLTAIDASGPTQRHAQRRRQLRLRPGRRPRLRRPARQQRHRSWQRPQEHGIDYLHRKPNELLTKVILGDCAGWSSTYWKCRRRGAIDFAALSVAAAVEREDDGTITDARIVFGAVASYPVSSDAAQMLIGEKLSDELIEACAAAASKVAKPLDNTDYTIGWRKKVARAYVAGALKELAGD